MNVNIFFVLCKNCFINRYNFDNLKFKFLIYKIENVDYLKKKIINIQLI